MTAKYPNNVLRLQLDENRSVFISFNWGEEHKRDQYNTRTTVSFVYSEGDWAAEWETQYGPIQMIHRKKLADGEVAITKRTEAKSGDPIVHHVWPVVEYQPLSGSQLAVDDNHLPQRLVDAEFDAIFLILRQFVESRITDEADRAND